MHRHAMPTGQPNLAPRRGRVALRGRTALGGSLVALCASLMPVASLSGPVGGTVTSGQATIAQTGVHTQINQATPTAVLDWQRFDIGVGESVDFRQPDAGSLTVNRVRGNIASDIAGKMTANGNVWIENGAGVFIRQSAEINVGGLIATTAKIDTDALDAGSVVSSGAPVGSEILAGGSITARKGGVVIVAPVVEQTGTIRTTGGDVAIGAGSGFTVDMDGDGLTRFAVAPADGARIVQSGRISAEGGAVYMSAADASAVQGGLVSVGGEIEATRIENRGGHIVITGGETGHVAISGTLDAAQPAGDGGEIAIAAKHVHIAAPAVIDASGGRNGGRVEIGGSRKGAAAVAPIRMSRTAPKRSPLPVARRVLVDKGATIAADAGQAGDGGTVIVWSEEATAFHGTIMARGGAEGGNGGFAEVSGRLGLGFDGLADLSAAAGASGTLLLDPENIRIIADDATADIDQSDAQANAANLFFTSNAGLDLTVSAAAIEARVSDLILEATNNITVETSIDDGEDGPAFAVSFHANNDIIVNPGSTISLGGDLSLTADNAMSLGAPIETAGQLSISTGQPLTLGALVVGSLSIVAGGTVSDTAGQKIAVAGATDITAGDATDRFDIGFDNDDLHDFSDTAAFSAFGEDLILDDANGVQLGNIDLAADGTDDPALNAAGVRMLVSVENDVTQAVGTAITVAGDTVLFDRSDQDASYTLDQAGNDFGGDLLVIGAGAILTDANTLSFAPLPVLGLIGNQATDLTGALTANSADISIADAFSVGGPVTLTNPNGGMGFGDSALDGYQLDGTEAAFFNDALTLDAAGGVLIDNVDYDFPLAVTARDGAITFANTGSSLDAAESRFDGIDIDLQVSLDATGQDVIFGNAGTDPMRIGLADDGDATTFDFSNDDFAQIIVGTLRFESLGTHVALIDAAPTVAMTIDAAGGPVSFDEQPTTLSAATTITGASSVTQDVRLSASDDLAIEATGPVTLDDPANDFADEGSGSSLSVEGSEISIADANSLDLGASAGTTLKVSAVDVGIVGDLSFEDTTVGGVTTPGSVTFVNSANDGMLIGAATASTDDTVFDVTDPGLARVTTPALTFINDETAAGTDAVEVQGVDFAGKLALKSGSGGVAFNTAPSTLGALDVTARGDVTQAAAVTVTGDTSITASGQNVTLEDKDNDFQGPVSAEAETISLRDKNALTLREVEATGTLRLQTGGGLILDDGGTVEVGSDLELIARDEMSGDFFDIEFDQPGGLSVAGTLSLTGGDILIDSARPVELKSVTAAANADPTIQTFDRDGDGTAETADNAGNLTVRAPGPILDGDGAILVAGQSRFEAPGFDIVLDNDGTHDFAGAVSADGVDVTLSDVNDLILGDVDAAGAFVAFAGNDILQDDLAAGAGNAVDVEGETTLTAGRDIVLDDIFNDFGGPVNLFAVNADVRDIDDIAFGSVDLGGNFTNIGGGDITDTAGAAILVAGDTSLRALDDGDVIFDNEDLHDFNHFGAEGRDITVDDRDDIDFLDTNALGNLTVDTNADQTQTGRIDVKGNASLTAEGLGSDIVLTGQNDFADVDARADRIDLTDRTGIELGQIESLGDANLIAAEKTLQRADGRLEVGGDFSVAGSTIVLANAGNDVAGTASATTSGDLTYREAGDVVFKALSATDVTARSDNGSVSNLGEDGLLTEVRGDLDVTASDQILLKLQQVAGEATFEGTKVIVIVRTGNLAVRRLFGADEGSLVRLEKGDLTLGSPLIQRGGSLLVRVDDGDIVFGDQSGSLDYSVTTEDGTTLEDVLRDLGVSDPTGTIAYSDLGVSLSAPRGSIVLPTNQRSGIVAGAEIEIDILALDENGNFVPATLPELIDGSNFAVEDEAIAELVGLLEVVQLKFGRDLRVTVPDDHAPGDGPFVRFVVPENGTVGIRTAASGGASTFAIGDRKFQDEIDKDAFNLFTFVGDLQQEQPLLDVSGVLNVDADGPTRFLVQNTSVAAGANSGAGTEIGGVLQFKSAQADSFVQISLFGQVDGQTEALAALETRALDFAPTGAHTVNGCIIDTLSSCTPLGQAQFALQFDAGQFLTITLVDPEQRASDPFSNRGDEEEWE